MCDAEDEGAAARVATAPADVEDGAELYDTYAHAER